MRRHYCATLLSELSSRALSSVDLLRVVTPLTNTATPLTCKHMLHDRPAGRSIDWEAYSSTRLSPTRRLPKTGVDGLREVGACSPIVILWYVASGRMYMWCHVRIMPNSRMRLLWLFRLPTSSLLIGSFHIVFGVRDASLVSASPATRHAPSYIRYCSMHAGY